ncbi:LysR family transcriptional regulator [Pseudoalteromonas sp. MMG013]|uniref:LysR family transcriptional regulator n=1 Tax=Pseudoalteromonas sp. MMG013 TaxID=2822687 RepID=UPI001B3823A9|nr:LysR family transcriptional regulator [Pseudoalteromonas sp. MMG013]MBQ4863518.1 LysR family transcriptional regulator [Pseudoalteromonas sp. MMG013]
MKRKIDIVRAINTFRLVVEYGSFSKAADHLSVVVSAVSRQVSDLEQHFGCQLLYRTTRAMSLTAEGEYYLEEFTELVNRLDMLEHRAEINQKAITGHIRMTAPPDAEELGITRLISEFMINNPGVKVTIMLLNRYVNLVEEGIDLAVRVHELSDSRLVARQFSQLNVLYVASPGYLAKHGTPKHPRELSEHNCVIDSSIRKPGRWRYYEGELEKHVNVMGQIEVNYGNIAADYSADGLGIAFLPDFLVRRYLNTGKLVPILESFQIPSAPVSLVYPANRIKNPALSELVRYLINNAP